MLWLGIQLHAVHRVSVLRRLNIVQGYHITCPCALLYCLECVEDMVLAALSLVHFCTMSQPRPHREPVSFTHQDVKNYLGYVGEYCEEIAHFKSRLERCSNTEEFDGVVLENIGRLDLFSTYMSKSARFFSAWSE